MVILRTVFFIMILGCASQFNPVSNTFINTKESYYTVWNSPIRGGGSGYSIYIVLDKKLDLNASKIEIQGIYFKDKYSALKYQKLRLYQGFIKNKANNNTLEMEGDLRKQLVEQCAMLLNSGWLTENALIYVEMEANYNSQQLPNNWNLLKEKIAGQVSYQLYQYQGKHKLMAKQLDLYT